MAYLNGEKVLLRTNVTAATLPIDQTYNPESENAQSGKAVAQAIANVSGGTVATEQLKLLQTITLEENVTDVNITFDKELKEIFVVMKIAFDAESSSATFCCRTDGGSWYPMRKRFNLTTEPYDFFMHIKEKVERIWETIAFDKPVSNIESNTTSGDVSILHFTKRPTRIKRFPKELNFFIQGRMQNFAIGSYFEIWGIEADENI